jgi:hypothetical protein
VKLTATDINQHIIQRHSPLVTRRGISSHIDIEQMLASGVIEGPARPVHPVTLSLLQRLVRRLRGAA